MNNDEIYKVISDLILKRNDTIHTTHYEGIAAVSEELRNYKKLVEEGIISEEDYNKKKNQIMGI